MSTKNTNKLNVPQARAAMDKFKMEAASEEDVTLYYSYDGTEWVLYTGPFAPTATPVYAKAVDRAGNESAVSRLAVQVTASQPVQTGDAAPVAVYTALLLTAAAALAAAPVLRRRRVK